MGILSGNPKDEPMHYGEVYGTWTALLAAKGMLASHQTILNHAGDGDLRKIIEEAIDLGKQEIKQLEDVLKENGVGLPPAPPDRPSACLDDIPVGARFQDPEIAASLAVENAAGLIACSKMIGHCIREDLAMMYGQMHSQKASLGAKILRLTKEKGWLVPPPLHKNKAEDC